MFFKVFDDFTNPVNMDMSEYFMNYCSLFGDGETHCHHEFSRAFPGEVFQYMPAWHALGNLVWYVQ